MLGAALVGAGKCQQVLRHCAWFGAPCRRCTEGALPSALLSLGPCTKCVGGMKFGRMGTPLQPCCRPQRPIPAAVPVHYCLPQGDGQNAGLYYFAPEQQLTVMANVRAAAELTHGLLLDWG